MQIKWLNDNFTEAIVTRGLLHKVSAHVIQEYRWKFASGDECPPQLQSDLKQAQYLAESAKRVRDNWKPVIPLPQAKVIPSR